VDAEDSEAVEFHTEVLGFPTTCNYDITNRLLSTQRLIYHTELTVFLKYSKSLS